MVREDHPVQEVFVEEVLIQKWRWPTSGCVEVVVSTGCVEWMEIFYNSVHTTLILFTQHFVCGIPGLHP